MSGLATDRRLTERVLIAAMMGVIVASMKQSAENDGEGELPEQLRHPIRRQVEKRFAHRLGQQLLNPVEDRHAMRLTETEMRANFERPLGLQYLIVAFWTQALAERGIIAIGSESCFSEAWEIMAKVMSTAWDELEKLEEIAKQGARELGESLERQGYFSQNS